jgi:uncharacterized protein YwgA
MTDYVDIISYLNALGIDNDLSSFVGRKRIQKAIYILKQFDGTIKLPYTWYLHGPYSPTLTQMLFNPADNSRHVPKELGKEELQAITDMRNFLGEDFYSVESLELIASLIYLIRYGKESGLDSKEKVLRFLMEHKPQYSKEEAERAWKKISDSGYWKDDLGKLDA